MADNIKELQNILKQLNAWKKDNNITDLLVNDYDWGICVTGYRSDGPDSDFTKESEVIDCTLSDEGLKIRTNRLQEHDKPSLEDVLDWIAEHDGNVLNDFNARFPGLIKEEN